MQSLVVFSRTGSFLVLVASLVGCKGKDTGKGGDDTSSQDGPPEISLSTTTLNFESIAVGTTAQQSFTVQNFGKSDLDVQGITVGAPFQTTFTNLVTLHPGGASIVNVTYAPSIQGEYEEALTITSTDPAQPTVTVTCVGTTVNDGDGDGFDAGYDPGEDCDDTDPDVNPAAEEIWYNGVDDNCLCENSRCSDFDQDGDGYDEEDYNSDPESYGGDCNDQNADFYPGAPDEWYDGYNTDCSSGTDYDQDLDGFGNDLYGSGTDCDDLDPSVNTDGTETYNGKDDDCDGFFDFELYGSTANWTFWGAASNDHFGTGLTTGNLDSDYSSEIIVGAPGYDVGGALAVFTGAALPTDGSDIGDATHLLVGSSGDLLGTEVAYLSDFGGTGAHVVVGGTGYSSNKGYAAVLLGDDIEAGSTLTASTDVRIEGTASNSYVGRGLSNDLDLDGDGEDEILGSYQTGSTISLWLLAGDSTLTGNQTTNEVDARFSTTGTETTMIDSFPGGSYDFDDDGYDDFLFCNGSGGSAGFGEAWILWGDATPYSNSTPEALDTVGSTVATGSSSQDIGFICGSGGDWTDDGKDDILLWSYDDTRFYLVEGDSSLRSASIDVATDSAALYQYNGGTNDPVELRDVGNLDDDGDNIHELALATSAEDPSPSVIPGQVYILSIADLGLGEVKDSDHAAQALIYGDPDADHGHWGEAIAGHAGDVTGGGGGFRTDIVVGDPEADNGKGGLFVFSNYNE